MCVSESVFCVSESVCQLSVCVSVECVLCVDQKVMCMCFLCECECVCVCVSVECVVYQ